MVVRIMDEYKKEFIDFFLEKEALKIGEFELKNGKVSPYFVNTGMFDDGESIRKLGYSYASKIADSFKPEEYDIIFGPAYKGIPLSVATTIALSSDFGINKGYSFNRKEPKDYGGADKNDIQKSWIVGDKIEDRDRILMIDDVFTTGDTKYESVDLLNRVADNLHYVGLIIAVDREEIGEDGKSAIKQFEQKTGIPVESIVNITETKNYLSDKGKISEGDLKLIDDYLGKYGID